MKNATPHAYPPLETNASDWITTASNLAAGDTFIALSEAAWVFTAQSVAEGGYGYGSEVLVTTTKGSVLTLQHDCKVAVIKFPSNTEKRGE
tara:strand:- start:5260 stop:5532 length:273 start_codon:yes stop_codon:yes gene_type:complete